MVNYKLYYFNMMGRAEISRVVFAQAGVKYEDIRLTPEEWKEFKPKTPFGQMPVLEIDGVQYCQGQAITGYLAREFGLYGTDNKDALWIDMFGLTVVDMMTKFPFSEKDQKKKEEGMKRVMAEVIPGMLEKMEGMLMKNKGGNEYFVSKLSVADMCWMLTAQFLQRLNPNVLAKTPKLDALAKKVAALPRIAAWLKVRPKTDF